jgi:hypothetical protein
MDVRSDDADIDALLGDTIAKVGESTKVLEASAKLQAMLDAGRGTPKPLVDPRTLPVRFTRLKCFALSGAHYLDAAQDDLEETLALRMGAGVHAALFLNRALVCYDGRRAGKAWERFERHHRERNAVILNEKEYVHCMGVVDSVRRHKRAMQILFDGTTREQRIDWTRGERACRATPDSFHADGAHNSDLKSARCTEPRWFGREALRRFYHAQLAFYDEPVELKVGRRPDENFLVAVENVRPFNVTVVRLLPEVRELGAKLCHLWYAQLLGAERAEYYGGYVEDDVDLELPDFEQRSPVTVEIDGQLMTIE